MARASRTAIEELIRAAVVKSVPAVEGNLKVNFDRRFGPLFEAKRVPGGVRLDFSINPADRHEFLEGLRRAALAVSQVYYKTSTAKSIRYVRVPSKALVLEIDRPQVWRIRSAADAEFFAAWANGGSS